MTSPTVAAKMGLVSKTSDGNYLVQSPGFATARFLVSNGHCSCGEEEGCWHKESAEIAEREGLVTEARQEEAKSSSSCGSVITPSQKTLIGVIASRKNVDAESLCQKWYHCSVGALRGREIQGFVDRLKSL